MFPNGNVLQSYKQSHNQGIDIDTSDTEQGSYIVALL